MAGDRGIEYLGPRTRHESSRLQDHGSEFEIWPGPNTDIPSECSFVATCFGEPRFGSEMLGLCLIEGRIGIAYTAGILKNIV